MDQAMVPAAQQHCVVETRLAAIGPVTNVVRIHETFVGAAGKGAAGVARP